MLVDGLSFLANPTSLALLAETGFLPNLLNNLTNFGQVALGLGFVIFVHELGHFLAAKTFGVRCDKFYIGFDVPISIGPINLPRTLGKFTWGETEYGIGIIPLGGYVKMLGQDDDPRRQAEENAKVGLGQDGESDAEPALDPRSYPAKPVWQRMIIISAGVVMNLIFAVILAGIAYGFGVPYEPTVAGSSFAATPAWEAGIEPGERIVRYGEMDEDDPHMRYRDFAVAVAMKGFDKKAEPIPLTLESDGERRSLTITPTSKLSKDGDIFRIGLNASNAPIIGPIPFSKVSFLSKSEPDLQEKDVITAVNGEQLPEDPRFGAVRGIELTNRLQANWRDSVTVSIERKQDESTETLDVTLPPVPVLSLGIGFEPGPVVSIRKGSKGEKAGVEVGDVITALNGEPVVDALQLPAKIARLSGQEVTLTLQRGASEGSEGETIDITIDGPEVPVFDKVSVIRGALTLGGLGIAFDVTNTVSFVDDAVGDKVQVGDKLKQYQWDATDEEKEAVDGLFTKLAFERARIDQQHNVANLYSDLQRMPEGANFKCFFTRDGKTVESSLPLVAAADWYWHQRGIGLSPLMDLHTTDSFATAASLGFRETCRRFTDVLDFLRLLVTGKIGAKGVGGPLAIVGAASSEASFGVSRLMLFLTLLSANLAILNFLPIPALDGGHMVFLTAEAIRGKPVSEALQIRLTMIGVLGLLGLMAFVIVNDILRYVG
ncbi:MAG: site-2 protease family protein [Aureliella sp.]